MFESTQAKYLGYMAIFLLLLTFGHIIKMIVLRQSSLGEWVGTIISIVFGALVILLRIFDVNCVILGGCNTWGWFKFAFMTFILIILMIAMIFALIQPKKKEEKPATTAPATTAVAPTAPVTTTAVAVAPVATTASTAPAPTTDTATTTTTTSA